MAMARFISYFLCLQLMHRGYYFEDVYLLRNEIEGSIGYIFLTMAMIVTSFKSPAVNI